MTPEEISRMATAAEAATEAWEWAMTTLAPPVLEDMTEGQRELVLEMVVEQVQAWCDQHPESPQSGDTHRFSQAVDAGFAAWAERKIEAALGQLEEMGLITNENGLITITDKGRSDTFNNPPAPDEPD